MKSKTVSAIAIAAAVFFLVAFAFSVGLEFPQDKSLSILISGVLIVFSLALVSSVLKNQEKILEKLNILTGETTRQSPKFSIPIPVARLKSKKRRAAIRKIRRTGFVSTASCTVNNYNIAVDDARREWVIVPPDGQGARLLPFSSYEGCEVIRDIGNSDGSCDVIALRIRVTGSDPCFVVIAVGPSAHTQDHEAKIKESLSVLGTIQ